MRIAGTPHFSLPAINNRLDLSNIKRAEVEARGYTQTTSKQSLYLCRWV